MNGLDNWLTEPKERDVVEVEDVDFNVDTSFIEEEDEEIKSLISSESNKGGENMECGGNIIGGVCDCHTHNCCPAVDGRSKLHPNCPHKEWVIGYRLFIARDVSKEVKAMYNKHGLKAFSVIKEDAETSLDNW